MSEQLTGRELDAEVAVNVMGWDVGTDSLGHECYRNGRYGFIYNFAPSTGIAAAWQVVERMRALKFWPSVELMPAEGCDYWLAVFDGQYGEKFSGKADTATEAICRAALKAVAHD